MEAAELRRLVVRHRHVAPMLSVLPASTNARVRIPGRLLHRAALPPKVRAIVGADGRILVVELLTAHRAADPLGGRGPGRQQNDGAGEGGEQVRRDVLRSAPQFPPAARGSNPSSSSSTSG